VRLALVGAGHAHLAVIARAGRLRTAGLNPVLIAPATFDYSGLAGAVLAGAIPRRDARIDIAALAQLHRVDHRTGLVSSLDRAARTLTLSDGAVEPYDLVSFNIGSTVDELAGTHAAVWPVKPLTSLFDLHRAIVADLTAGRSPSLIVVGDGPSAFELAASLIGLHERMGRTPDVILIGPGADADWAPAGAPRHLVRSLEARGLRRVRASVVGHAEGEVRLNEGRVLTCDHLVVATGLRAPALTANFDLPLDSLGRLRVTPTLQSPDDPAVFAAGDCAAIEGYPRPSAGVFGVRAAGVLIDNLCATAKGKRPGPYRPQTRWLSILDLADGTGLAMRGHRWCAGRLALRLKRHLDLGFVKRSRA
jgi:NADH dehydrogenase FAD-containing subunit